MTFPSSDLRLTTQGTGLLPRVNLLPPDIAEKRAFQRIQLGLGGAALAAVSLVGLLYFSASHSVTSANESLSSAQATNSTLQRQAAKFRDVTQIYAAAAAAQVQLSSAMGDEIRYSQLLNDLALTVPSSVWVTSVGFVQTPTSRAVSPAGTLAVAAPVAGTFTVSGVGFSHVDVALWLEAVAGLKTYANPYFTNSTEVLLGKRKTVNFSSTANLTPQAMSNRYGNPAGG
jgi:Tfp pilus assembly protein PilN